MEEEKEFQIPEELQKEIIDIMNDSPDLRRLGKKEYRVYHLRMYSLNRILKIGFDLLKDSKDDTLDDKKLMFAMCTDLDIASEIIAIILCNHLFQPDNVDIKELDKVDTYNDTLIKYMKQRILNSTFEDNQWAAIILGALKSIDLSKVFTMLVLVKQYLVSLTKTRMKAEEQLQLWREVQSVT